MIFVEKDVWIFLDDFFSYSHRKPYYIYYFWLTKFYELELL